MIVPFWHKVVLWVIFAASMCAIVLAARWVGEHYGAWPLFAFVGVLLFVAWRWDCYDRRQSTG
jgi:Flp pilus assembly protein TadB